MGEKGGWGVGVGEERGGEVGLRVSGEDWRGEERTGEKRRRKKGISTI